MTASYAYFTLVICHFTLMAATEAPSGAWPGTLADASAQVVGLRSGAGERIRTAGLLFTRRLLCRLSYTGRDSLHVSSPWADVGSGQAEAMRPWCRTC